MKTSEKSHKYRWQAAVFVLTAFMLGCNEFMVVGVISNIARSYHASLSAVGILVTMFALVYAFCTPIITTLTAKFSRFKLLMVLMLVFLVGNTLTALAPSLFWMFVSRIITAAVAGPILSLIMVFVTIVAPIDKRALLVAFVFAGFSIATIIGVPIGTAISTAFSWHASFWMISLITILVTILLYRLTPRHSRQVKGSIKSQLRLLGNSQIIIGALAIIAFFAAEYTFYTFIRPIITSVLGFSVNSLNLLLSLIGIMFVIGNACAGIVASRYGTKVLPLIALVLIVLLFGMRMAFSSSSWVGVLLLCLVCFVLALPASIIQVLFLDIAEKKHPEAINLASSLNPICSNLGVSIGSLTGSVSLAAISLDRIGYVGAVYALIALMTSLILAHKS